jgi:hypothetical protein
MSGTEGRHRHRTQTDRQTDRTQETHRPANSRETVLATDDKTGEQKEQTDNGKMCRQVNPGTERTQTDGQTDTNRQERTLTGRQCCAAAPSTDDRTDRRNRWRIDRQADTGRQTEEQTGRQTYELTQRPTEADVRKQCSAERTDKTVG